MTQNTSVQNYQNNLQEIFQNDTNTIAYGVEAFFKLVYPSYMLKKEDIDNLICKNNNQILQSMTFFRINNYTIDKADDIFESINSNFEKLFTALYAIDIPIAYGLVSRNGKTDLVLGIYESNQVTTVKTITEGMLSGIEIEHVEPDFSERDINMNYGVLSGIPSLYVHGEKQKFSLSSIMRSLNGQNYTVLFIAKPISQDIISEDINKLISIKDNAFAVSKRNIARSESRASTTSETNSTTEGKNSIAGQIGMGIGAVVGSVAGTTGIMIGGAVGSLIGNLVGQGESSSKGYSETISEMITNGETISADIQNGFAIELIHYAENAIERLKGGQNNGMWQTAIVYSGENEISRNVIKACLKGELSKIDSEKLPMIAFEPYSNSGDVLLLPDIFQNTANGNNGLCSYLNSAELGLLCTLPTDNVPDFELRVEKKYPMVASHNKEHIKIGNVVDGKRVLDNMVFAFSDIDLNKHVFVCGITGSGKTTTVQKILLESEKPFLVIESAKKEYRNLNINKYIYTPGKPELNAPQINPFYVMPGVSPQIHIDFLKDLFSASFSFYGPMPYILEKCLHTVYKNKGWNLTLGYHPLLVNEKNSTTIFDFEYTKSKYNFESHKFLFPTMQELRDEIERYIEEDLQYNGEVADNIKTAMRIRLENLCIGTKGYSFNTHNMLDFDDILQNNIVFELEGLADDSDKAFCVGLLVIFINEYRQVYKESVLNKNLDLQHLLVVEEAHRLLKNVDVDRSVEMSNNAKGKAVEHFTNMIAEMRSYGQGVIIAEQIPTKLAPDVIKNSSTKIVHRIVSVDDQQVIANTLGIDSEDSIQLGNLESGYAYCHKEGMLLPTVIKVYNIISNNNAENYFDVYMTDEQLYYNNQDKFVNINYNIIRERFGGDIDIKRKALGLINTLMIEDEDICIEGCKQLMEYMHQQINQNDIRLVLKNSINIYRLLSNYLSEVLCTLMLQGTYRVKSLISNDYYEKLGSLLYAPSKENITDIKQMLCDLYSKDLSNYAKKCIIALIQRNMSKNIDITGTIYQYFITVSECTVNELKNKIKEGSK